MDIFSLLLCLLLSYLIGSIPSGYLLVKSFKRVDIREFGSGNIGFTNVLRVAGKLLAGFTLGLDAAKGWLAVALFARWFCGRECLHLEWFQVGGFAGAVAGHVFTVFLGFRGGKGIATAAGALLALSPPIFIISLSLWLLLLVAFRYVSLASIAASGAIPFLMYFLNRGPVLVIFSSVLAVLVIWRHKDNIGRLLARQERKIGEPSRSSEQFKNQKPGGGGIS